MMSQPRRQNSRFSNHRQLPLLAESNDDANDKASIRTTSTSSDNDEYSESDWQPEKVLASLIKSLWKGVTIPFPQLRKTMQQNKQGVVIGFRMRESFAFILSYLACGVLAYSVLFEKWSIVDSLYFTCVCFSTVGYGDLCPTTAAGRLFTCFFGLSGIALLGVAIATICSSLVQAEVEAAKKVETVGKRRLLRMLRDMPQTLSQYRKASRTEQEKLIKKAAAKSTKKKGKEVPKGASRVWSKTNFVLSGLYSLLPSLSIILSGGAIMGYLNGGWSVVESIYYSIITASTIGFGDLAPVTPQARLFAVLFIPLSVGAAGELLSSIATKLIQQRQKKAYETQFHHNLTLSHLKAMDTDENGSVCREEYVYFMLKEMGLVSPEDLAELFAQFDSLDVTNDGSISIDDIKLMAKLRGAQVLE